MNVEAGFRDLHSRASITRIVLPQIEKSSSLISPPHRLLALAALTESKRADLAGAPDNSGFGGFTNPAAGKGGQEDITLASVPGI